MFAPDKFYESIKSGKTTVDDLTYYLKRAITVLDDLDMPGEADGLKGALEYLESAMAYLNTYEEVFKHLEQMFGQRSTVEDLKKAIEERSAKLTALSPVLQKLRADLARSGRTCMRVPNPHRKSECSEPSTCCNPE